MPSRARNFSSGRGCTGAAGISLVMNVDVQGVRSIKEVAKSDPMLRNALVTVFIAPLKKEVVDGNTVYRPDMKELRSRLIYRGHDDEEEIQRRLATAGQETRSIDIFDKVIESGSRKADFANVLAVWQEKTEQVAGRLP